MHDVFGQVLHPHGLESAGPDMQRDEGLVHPERAKLREQGVVEMQPGGGRGDGTRLAGVDRLVPLVVLGAGLVRDVGWKRHRTESCEQIQYRGVEAQREQVPVPPEDFGVERVGQAQP